MKVSKIKIKNFRSIKDSGEIVLKDNIFVLAGQNESGKSSILEALECYIKNESNVENLNFELANNENFIQEVSVTYEDIDEQFCDNIINDLEILIQGINQNQDLNREEILKEGIIKALNHFTITKTFNFENNDTLISTSVDANTLNKLKGFIKVKNISENKEKENLETDKETVKEPVKEPKVPFIDIDEHFQEISEMFSNHTMPIILFNDFQNLLPDKILLDQINNDKGEGAKAVKNFEKLMQRNFRDISNKSTASKNSLAEEESNKLSISFQEDWQQRIFGDNKVNIKFFIENNNKGEKEVSFYIETKDREFLEPRRRSKGMIWFLSLWLELEAKKQSPNMLLLFDEPGLHLHIKANKDILSVFNKLVENGHQVIYATHSPALIDTDNLHQIGLVLNDKKNGTTIEGLTSCKIDTENKRDALQPISEAMGLEPLKDFSILKEKNVLLEGLSDFWYFKAMCILLDKKISYEFIPGIGVKGEKMYPLISFCIGYGLDWLLIIDSDKAADKTHENLLKIIFSENKDDAENKIYRHSENDIENLFHKKDFSLIDPKIEQNPEKNVATIIGEKRKILFAKEFYTKVKNKDITKRDMQSKTLENFEQIFKWIDLNIKNTSK